MSIRLLKEVGCPQWVINHSKKVAEKALEISKNFKVDRKLIKEAALLHDIGRCKTNNIQHGIIGAKILKERGYPKSIIKIVERHIGAGIPKDEAILLGLPPKDYIPVTLEEKIVAHADNLINGEKEVDISFVLKKWEKKLGKNHPAIERLKKLHRELEL
ncbi:TIGR00295 family protein [Methanothermobacter tenebrarum]|uniref:TIGR00295 family protein n=1 Tax=Methanothermobacter tenebrarum TaxID=680118 RepID=A0A328P9D0_9EURY|nr:TIGR00295 family protein [Methanothermobacter tenebrarum]MBC7100852.1 TIGR00295 family protein [Methanobacteriales archaeon]MBC7117858.1 TIGR00295 family protein [Methanobacteriaceae archaeon]NPV63993.1 TIGR00295 family protein [Methanobacteriaceae archaeon]RAO79168.1 TIGR00295 family protein [Methanothermobacter tenebrarum]